MPSTEDSAEARNPRIAGSRALLLAIALGLLLLLFWRLSDLLLLLFGAVIAAVALDAMAARLRRWLPLSQRAAVGITVALTLAVATAGGWLAGDQLVEQASALQQRLPRALAELGAWAGSFRIGQSLQEVWLNAQADDVPWASVANAATSTLGAIGSIGLMLVVAVYLAADPTLYRLGLVRLVPRAYRDSIDSALLASGHALGRWLLGQGVSMLFVGATTAIGLAVLGVPLALTVGLIAGVLAFVPFFGPIASGALAVLLAFTQGPTQALYVGALSVAIQQVEGNLLMPWVQRWAVELPPVLGITAAVIFGLLFGLPGIVLATPMMVVVMVLVQRLYVEELLEAEPADAAARP